MRVLQRFVRNSGWGPRLNSFAFHETDSLAQDLAKLLQQPMIGSDVECNAARQTPGKSSAAFPGIILLYDGHPCAAISYARESDATVVVAPPVSLIDATSDVRSNLYEVLLKRVKRISVDAGFLQMNFLQHDSSVESVFLSLLAEQRFVPAAKILRWELPTSPESAAHQSAVHNLEMRIDNVHVDCTLHRFDMTNADADEIHEIQSALDAILSHSDDLPYHPRPQADHLLAKWQTMEANIFTCRMQGRIAGILSCVACMATESVSEIQKACVAESLSESYLSLEYVGVVPEFRRRQLASWLIGQMKLLLHQSVSDVACETVSAVTTVKAFSDAANAPATALYQSQGFALAAEMQLWCCKLNNEQSEKYLTAWN